MPEKKKEQVLSVRDLDITFKTTAGPVHAIRGVNIDLYKGETVALVGESGSGKSVTMKAAMGILAQNAIVNSGSIQFSYHHADGSPETVDLLQKDKKWIRRHINGKRIAMVFQDPMTSLDPTMPIGKQIMEGMLWHYKMPKDAAYKKAVQLLEEVGITDAEKRMKSYPHQLSGGMRQRVVIAIALACDPDLLICDEPTTALDVTIQAKILELIRSIQRERGISVIYITHDLGVVAKVADYVDVMYAGKIVETGTIDEIFYEPRHPYTWGLLSAMPDLDTADDRLYTIPGSPPNLLHEKQGDAFAPRNHFALNIDDEVDPPMFKISDTHYAATWLLDPRAPKVDMPPELAQRIARMRAEGRFLLDWSAHGLSYGLRSAAFLDGPKLVNLSRRILPQAVAALPGLRVIHVFARPEVLAQRLAARGREDADQIAARIARDTGALPAGLDIIHIDNSTTIEAATTAFLAALETVHI